MTREAVVRQGLSRVDATDGFGRAIAVIVANTEARASLNSELPSSDGGRYPWFETSRKFLKENLSLSIPEFGDVNFPTYREQCLGKVMKHRVNPSHSVDLMTEISDSSVLEVYYLTVTTSHLYATPLSIWEETQRTVFNDSPLEGLRSTLYNPEYDSRTQNFLQHALSIK